MGEETPRETAERVVQYLETDDQEFIRKLSEAETIGDQRDILVAYTKQGYTLINLFTNPSPTAVEVVQRLTQLLSKKERQKTLTEPIAVRKPRKVIAVRSRTGALLYKKTQPRAFSRREVLFLMQSRQRNLSGKKTIEKFNELFRQRTASSILSKRYRI
jgi:hypothetical protein